jgi:hypothetical protein
VIASAALVLGLLATGPDDREPHPSRAAASRIVATAALAPSRWRAFQRCVEHRESNNQPGVVNSSGHAGLYQFSRQWAHGLPYMVAKRLRANGMSPHAARTVRIQLQHLPIQRWSAQMQRVAFSAVIATPGGDRHWALAGSSCEALR